MKRKGLAIAVFTVQGFIAGAVFAADGTITFTGQIEGTTCSISGGTGAAPGTGANFPVVLDKVQVSALSADGQVAASKPFFIYVGDSGNPCTASPVQVLFESTSPGVNPATGSLFNTAAAGAPNVEVQIVDAAINRAIDLRLGAKSTATIPDNGIATLRFAAQYIARGAAAGPGAVAASVQYSVTFP